MAELKTGFRNQLIENSIWNTLSSIINRVGAFIFVFILFRALKPEGFGSYSLSLSLSLFFITILDMGLNQALIRFVSVEFSKNKKKATAYFSYILKFKILLTIALTLVLVSVSFFYSYFFMKDPSFMLLILISGFYVIILSFEGFFESLFFIRNKVKYISIKEVLFQCARIFTALIIFYFIAMQFRVMTLFIFLSLFSIIIIVFMIRLSKKIYPFLFQKTYQKIKTSEVFRFIFFLNIQGISFMILSQASIIILGIFLSTVYIGYYNSAYTIVFSVASFMTLTSVILPILSQLKQSRFDNALKSIFRILMIFAFPISFGLACLSRYFIVLIAGYDYLAASPALSILSFLIIPFIGTNYLLSSFSAKGKPSYFFRITLFSIVFFIILTLVMVVSLLKISPQMSINGAAMAAVISWFLYFALSARLVYKKLKISIISPWLIKPLAASIVMSACILFVLNIFTDINLFNGILIVLLGIFVYFAVMFIIKGFKKEELLILKDFIFINKNKSQ